MIDNEILAVALFEQLDYATAYRCGLVAYFFDDTRHLATVGVAGSSLAETVSVACLGAALGADQSAWVSGAVDSDADDPLLDPAAHPYLAMLFARRDGLTAYWRRPLSVLDDGSVMAAGDMEERSVAHSGLAGRVVIPWILEHPASGAEEIAAWLKGRGHSVLIT